MGRPLFDLVAVLALGALLFWGFYFLGYYGTMLAVGR